MPNQLGIQHLNLLDVRQGSRRVHLLVTHLRPHRKFHRLFPLDAPLRPHLVPHQVYRLYRHLHCLHVRLRPLPLNHRQETLQLLRHLFRLLSRLQSRQFLLLKRPHPPQPKFLRDNRPGLQVASHLQFPLVFRALNLRVNPLHNLLRARVEFRHQSQHFPQRYHLPLMLKLRRCVPFLMH